MTAGSAPGPLATTFAGLSFRNPIVLAAGTAGYGAEVSGVVDLRGIGGLVTKAVSVEPRTGAPAPRVAEFAGGMINAIGLANPGLAQVRDEHLPWLARNGSGARVVVNVIGNTVDQFAEVVSTLDETPGVDAFELNVSCPNTKAGGIEFGADPSTLAELVKRARASTKRPVLAKLSPTLPDVVATARVALDAGADGLTLVNTIPGMVIDTERRAPALGFGTGGVSGRAILPVGVLATAKVYRATRAPIVGLGGVESAEDALQYLIAGASLVGMGTAALRDPRAPERVIRGLERWLERHGVRAVAELVGSLDWRS